MKIILNEFLNLNSIYEQSHLNFDFLLISTWQFILKLFRVLMKMIYLWQFFKKIDKCIDFYLS